MASHREDIDPRQEKRPARRYYRLTATGAVKAGEALTKARRPSRTALRGLAKEGGRLMRTRMTVIGLVLGVVTLCTITATVLGIALAVHLRFLDPAKSFLQLGRFGFI
ncbi:hypothetical protein ACFXPJ_37615 [Streptomyces goshikiensis]